MKQFRVTGIDNRTNKPLQAMVDAVDEAAAYVVARRQFATIERIDRIVSAPTAAPGAKGSGGGSGGGGGSGTLGRDLGPSLDDVDEDDEDDMPDLSSFGVEAPRVSGGMKGLLRRFHGQRIAINLADPDKFIYAKLLSISEDCFSVRAEGSPQLFHFPIRSVVGALETAPAAPSPTVPTNTPGLFIELPRTLLYKVVASLPAKA